MSFRVLSSVALLALSLGTVAGCAADDGSEADDSIESTDDGATASAQDLTASKTQKLKIGDTAHFERFDVTLRKLVNGKDFEIGFDVKVCAKRSEPVSWAPWGAKTVFGTLKATHEKDSRWSGSQLYPVKRLKAGECAQGIVPFVNEDGETITALVYKNSLGDVATWK